MGEAAKKKEPSFYLKWADIKPPPGANPESTWRRCMAGCLECGYNTVSESMVGEGFRSELQIEEQVLDILRFSAVPIHCMHFTAFMIAYAHRGEEQKAAANRISAASLLQMKLIDQMKEEEEHAKPKRKRARKARPRKAARDGEGSRKRRRQRKPATSEKAEGGAGRGVSGRKRREDGRSAKADRPVAKKTRVRDPLAKRARKTDADGD